MGAQDRLCLPVSRNRTFFRKDLTHGLPRSGCGRLCPRGRVRRYHPRPLRCRHRWHDRLLHRIGDRLRAGGFAVARPAHRGRAARQPAHHLRHGRHGDPAPLRPDAARRQHHLGHRLCGRGEHLQFGRQGRRADRHHHRIPLFRLFRSRADRSADHRHRAHLGRRQSDGPDRGHLALAFRIRSAKSRPVHRGQDGGDQHPGLSWPRLCGVRESGADRLRQPAAATVVRGLRPAARSRHRRGAGAGRDDDPRLGRVCLRHRCRDQDRRRHQFGRERQRHRRHARSGGVARPAGGVGPGRR